MAGPGVSDPASRLASDPVAARVLVEWLDELGAALFGNHRDRAAIVTELGDGLRTAAELNLTEVATNPEEAARAAVTEFGPPRLVAAGFIEEIAAGQARRAAVGLLVFGPIVGAAWLASAGLLWPLRPWPLLTEMPLLVAVLAVAVPAAVLAAAAAGGATRWFPIGPSMAPTAALVATLACVAGDTMLLVILGHATLGGATPTATAWLAGGLSAARLCAAAIASARCAQALAALR